MYIFIVKFLMRVFIYKSSYSQPTDKGKQTHSLNEPIPEDEKSNVGSTSVEYCKFLT